MEPGTSTAITEYVLGLDIGSNSIGWALLGRVNKRIIGIERMGVRIFDAGVEGDIESGKDESRATKRREARLRRRMLSRQTMRLVTLSKILQRNGFLPDGDLTTAEARFKFFTDLDANLFSLAVRREHPDTYLYRLRAKALDNKLTPHELGRALYHLAQRRGFLSNRKARRSEKEDDDGQVKESISHLRAAMTATATRTIGEYFSRLNPHQERIRSRWTARDMYVHEFDRVWDAQAKHHSTLTPSLKKQVYKAIFYQRPLKWDRATIGQCDLEPGRKRAPLAILVSQRFRLMQKVNDMIVKGINPETQEQIQPRLLNTEERKTLADALERTGDLKFSKIKTLLGLPKWAIFNIEEGGEKTLIGNRTAAKLRSIFASRWDEMSSKDRDRIVEDVLSIQNEETQRSRGSKAWGLQGNEAEEFGKLVLEPGHLSLSRQAITNLLPLLELGHPFATARQKIYGDKKPPRPANILPPLSEAPIQAIRNPAVSRALTELRKVVNAIARQYGKPSEIRIELARDLKKTRKDRKRIWKQNNEQRTRREEGAARLISEAGIKSPSSMEIEKWLLANECDWHCPYTGKPISMKSLFGDEPQFDVEHIIPFKRCLDNSFMNKTLCDVHENRNEKRNRTPWEAYGSIPDRWEEILQRVRTFKGDAARAKLERFQLQDLESFDDFTQRQLNDTRYASLQAIEYLGLLYGSGGGGVDADHTRCIHAGRGAVTKYLRDELGLNRILGDGGTKNRADHRHHAVDAVCIALSDASMVALLSRAAEEAWAQRRRRFASIPAPWGNFGNDVQTAVGTVAVSHRVSRKVSAAIHEETIYSKPHKDVEGRVCTHVRKRVEALSRSELADIVDPVVKDAVLAKLGNGEPKKVFADKNLHPRMKSGVPIHTVRIRKHERTIPIAQGVRMRHVIAGSNHHLEVLECLDQKGSISWDGCVVSTYEAMQRLRNREPVVRRNHEKDKRFLFSLAGGDTIEMVDESQTRQLYLVRSVWQTPSGPRIACNLSSDARKKEAIKESKALKSPRLNTLRKAGCRKVLVTPIGDVREAHD